ncbi:MAG TPA: GNAT family N-acetyltransferase [Roseiflexaceae bacterium]|nr:GNAT family N-acetyltransferase [Roseiflexaceae bacterium]
MTVFETERLALRRFTLADAPFVLELLNDPDWHRYIGDRGVRTLQQAENYIVTVPMQMYDRLGFGLYLVEHKASGEPIGMCGLLKRDFLEDVDLGFAFLARHRAQGYALEAALGTLGYARSALGLGRVAAIVAPDNERSARLLEKLGFRFERMVSYPGETEQLRLFISR